ncbi:hypothetical protein BD770DRAFT_439275 [Pilaira anomala]|nr:hypothetical protein BD770DRAFT_439275 [Pilaira anomala]
MDTHKNKSVRERADAIERLQKSSIAEAELKRRSDIGLPGYSRSTTSSFKRASLSGLPDNQNRHKRFKRSVSSNSLSGPIPPETTDEGDDTISIALYAKLLQYQHLNWEMEQQYKKLKDTAETELNMARQVLQELEFQELQKREEENSQNVLDDLCKQISSCMDRIDIITEGGRGDLGKEKQELINILNELNDVKIPNSQVHTGIKLLMECRTLIQNIIEVM